MGLGLCGKPVQFPKTYPTNVSKEVQWYYMPEYSCYILDLEDKWFPNANAYYVNTRSWTFELFRDEGGDVVGWCMWTGSYTVKEKTRTHLASVSIPEPCRPFIRSHRLDGPTEWNPGLYCFVTENRPHPFTDTPECPVGCPFGFEFEGYREYPPTGPIM